MSQLPKGWAEDTLGRLVAVERGSSPRPIKNFLTDSEDGVNWIKIGDAKKGQKLITATAEKITKEGATKSRFVDVGDFILSNSMSFGLPYIMGIPGYIHDGWFVFRLPKQINSDYFYYLLSSSYVSEQFNNLAVGGVVKNISGDLVKKAILPLPPFSEQQRIVEKLDEVLAQVDTIKARLDGIPAILKRFRQSVLAAAVSGKLTEEWRGKNVSGCAESELNANFSRKSGKLKLRGKQANLNELSLLTLPSSWTWTQNYKLAKDASNAICAGPFGTIFKAKDFRDEGVPIIFLRHVKEDGFNQHKPNYMDRAVWEELHQEYSVHGGELLVTKLGDPPGECCIYPENTGTSMVTPDVLKMDVDEQSAEKKYLRSYFNSPISTEIIEKLAFGATRLRIDIAMFKAFPVPLPPMEEQKEIVRLVDQYFAFADTIEAQVKKAQARVDKLTQSILAKAFRGELVPQDPNDEPADKLLERIAAARKEAEALAKAAKKAAKK